jgi:chromosome segregation ATPase
MASEQTPPENRGRRVTDQHGGLLDAAQQAVRIERMEGDHRLLAQRVSSGMENVSNTLASVQAEMRGLRQELAKVAELRYSHDNNKTLVEELRRSMTEMNNRLEGWFVEHEERNLSRWKEYEANRDQWRIAHETDNEKTKTELAAEIRAVRERVIRYVGYGTAVGALGGVIVSGFLWNIDFRFDVAKQDIVELSKDLEDNSALSSETAKKLVDIQLYLARGGRMPEEPYVPPTQRSDQDGKQQEAGKPGK